MKKNLFDMSPDFGDEWSSDNKAKVPTLEQKLQILTPQKHYLYFAKEKRRGKIVTIVGEFALAKEDLLALLKRLKTTLGTGGTLKENRLEFQGDIKEKLSLVLKELGYGLRK